MYPPTTPLLTSTEEVHQTATGIITRWSEALTAIMRVDHIAFVERGWAALSLSVSL